MQLLGLPRDVEKQREAAAAVSLRRAGGGTGTGVHFFSPHGGCTFMEYWKYISENFPPDFKIQHDEHYGK